MVDWQYNSFCAGKTLLARAIASNIDANFLKIVSSAIVDKYIGESARLIREMFGYARDHQPCIIFMDEIDAIGGRRFSEGTSADREIQRTLMELLSQLDGFDMLGKVGIPLKHITLTPECRVLCIVCSRSTPPLDPEIWEGLSLCSKGTEPASVSDCQQNTWLACIHIVWLHCR